jgi:hypothetical protein
MPKCWTSSKWSARGSFTSWNNPENSARISDEDLCFDDTGDDDNEGIRYLDAAPPSPRPVKPSFPLPPAPLPQAKKQSKKGKVPSTKNPPLMDPTYLDEAPPPPPRPIKQPVLLPAVSRVEKSK